MKIAFFLQQYSVQGTEIANYDYAHYNETILNNKSIIISYYPETIKKHNLEFNDDVFDKFRKRFTIFFVNNFDELEDLLIKEYVDIFYHLKSGEQNNYPFGEIKKIKTLNHCVFNSTYNHGNLYAVISNSINKRYNTSYSILPHIVTVHETTDNLRKELNIPDGSLVFGRYGGYEYNVDFVKNVIVDIANEYPNIYFIFMNTRPFSNIDIKNIIYLPGTTSYEIKRKFINTCDAFIHARSDGETFGITVGEFSLCKKPTLSLPVGDLNHFDILGDKIIPYYNYSDLKNKLLNFKMNSYNMNNNGYMFFTPENVMKIFNLMIQFIMRT